MQLDKRMEVSVYQKAKKGNYYCGDSYFYQETENEFICALADGLGSGEYARESSQAVMSIIENNIHSSVEQIVKECNKSLLGKRGVVLGVLKVDFQTMEYAFSSIGNIGIMSIASNNEKKRNIPNSGYIGGVPRPVKVLNGRITDDLIFVMFSDGVSSRDLSAKYFLGKDVHAITESFSSLVGINENDDTTLIAMKCRLA
ncbi:protein phosphatase 2C domain-containing protein [Aquibacillus kalidii]|uniref:protein phosphatase 2C domain-containing protein n=1 Tax=Aquibacillus kalidii TaxID=2762597 RepID=UPI00164480F4|nr:protein phosphatase 2C domain-containing protein [Aquibacillus kalidii]